LDISQNLVEARVEQLRSDGFPNQRYDVLRGNGNPKV